MAALRHLGQCTARDIVRLAAPGLRGKKRARYLETVERVLEDLTRRKIVERA